MGYIYIYIVGFYWGSMGIMVNNGESNGKENGK